MYKLLCNKICFRSLCCPLSVQNYHKLKRIHANIVHNPTSRAFPNFWITLHNFISLSKMIWTLLIPLQCSPPCWTGRPGQLPPRSSAWCASPAPARSSGCGRAAWRPWRCGCRRTGRSSGLLLWAAASWHAGPPSSAPGRPRGLPCSGCKREPPEARAGPGRSAGCVPRTAEWRERGWSGPASPRRRSIADPSQSIPPVQLMREVERRQIRMLLVSLHLLFHSRVREV